MHNTAMHRATLNPSACLEYLGLNRNPFPVAPDVESFYRSPRIDDIVTQVLHAILARKGFLVITGEIGLGKTTISRRLLKALEDNEVETALIFHTFYQGVELLEEINKDFGVTVQGTGLQANINALNDFLLERNSLGRNCAIIIDDAQNLSMESLELIRLISNLESDSDKLVQILLVGQPELGGSLNSPALRQLKSRVVIHATVQPLSLDELKQYVLFKLNDAGGEGSVDVPERTFRRLHKLTGGNLRQVNILMDRCLYASCAHSTARINVRLLNEAAEDLKVDKPTSRPTLTLVAGLLLAGALAVYWQSGVRPAILFDGATPFAPAPVAAPVDLPGAGAQVASVEPDTRGASPGNDAAGTAKRTGATFSRGGNVPAALPDTDVPPADTAVPVDVQEFLSLHGLDAYTRELTAAIGDHNFNDFASKISNETDYVLISLAHVPAPVKSRYARLRVATRFGDPVYLMFWKPELRIDSFYYRYQGAEIVSLQKKLQKLHLYNSQLDGIVGPQLMSAVAEFQRAQGLTPKGTPDPVTLFLLSNAAIGQG